MQQRRNDQVLCSGGDASAIATVLNDGNAAVVLLQHQCVASDDGGECGSRSVATSVVLQCARPQAEMSRATPTTVLQSVADAVSGVAATEGELSCATPTTVFGSDATSIVGYAARSEG